jgi:probable rRNA maturation factor
MPNTASRRKPPALSLTVQYASDAPGLPPRWRLRRWVAAALDAPAELTLRIVDEAEGQTLNRDYRGRDYPTNVLSFVYSEGGILAGDLVLCAPVVVREAEEQGKSLLSHYAHLVVHGVLHVRGFDHETETEAEAMEALEVTILARLGFNDPYAGPSVERQAVG